jgi:hypothetical protein
MFDNIISIFVGINLLALMSEYYGAPEYYTNFLESLNTLFVTIFTIEAILKLIAYNVTYYFTFG